MNNKEGERRIPVTEIFESLQGESLYTGTPSIFIRLFGCSFRCQGFGMPKGELSNEYMKVNPADYNDLSQLPLVKTGCDSYPSWDPRFKHLQMHLTAAEIVEKIYELVPNPNRFPDIIFTGGEPLLKGQQKNIVNIIEELEKKDGRVYRFTFETNGTVELIPELSDALGNHSVFFSISAKLSSSGEQRSKAIRPEAVASYMRMVIDLYGLDYYTRSAFKFVVSHPEDLNEVDEVLKIYTDYFKSKHFHEEDYPEVYIMPVGGVNDVYDQNFRWVAAECLKRGFKFSQRLQIPLYKNQWAT